MFENRCGLGPNILTKPSEELYNGVAAPATVAAIIEARRRPPKRCFSRKQQEDRQPPYTLFS